MTPDNIHLGKIYYFDETLSHDAIDSFSTIGLAEILEHDTDGRPAGRPGYRARIFIITSDPNNYINTDHWYFLHAVEILREATDTERKEFYLSQIK